MKFRILEIEINKKTKYKVYYFDEFNNRGQQWNQIIFKNHDLIDSYTDTIEEAEYQAALFYERWIKENGKIIKEFEY